MSDFSATLSSYVPQSGATGDSYKHTQEGFAAMMAINFNGNSSPSLEEFIESDRFHINKPSD